MRTPLVAALLAMLSAAGCVTAPITWPDDKPAAKETRAARPAPAPVKASPVKPDHVTPNNAYKAVEALQAELDTDAIAPPWSSSPEPLAEVSPKALATCPTKGKGSSKDK